MSVRALEAAAPARSTLWLRLTRSRGLITAIVVFLALLLVVDAVNTAPLSADLAGDRALMCGCVVGAAPAPETGTGR